MIFYATNGKALAYDEKGIIRECFSVQLRNCGPLKTLFYSVLLRRQNETGQFKYSKGL